MKKLLIALVIFGASPLLISAQKHAPRPYTTIQSTPGIYPEASNRLLQYADIKGLNNWDLKVMRNEIFARHGYIFKTAEMIDYFSQQSWYEPIYDNVDELLTVVERKNISFIKKYEK